MTEIILVIVSSNHVSWCTCCRSRRAEETGSVAIGKKFASASTSSSGFSNAGVISYNLWQTIINNSDLMTGEAGGCWSNMRNIIRKYRSYHLTSSYWKGNASV